jgi:cytochrome c peroxidase
LIYGKSIRLPRTYTQKPVDQEKDLVVNIRQYPALFCVAILSSSQVACGGGGGSSTPGAFVPTQATVGKKIFFDANLSSQSNQACGDCHDPAAGFADPNVTRDAPVSEGSESGSFGNRNAPTAAYASLIPDFVKTTTQTVDSTVSNYQGGQFLDGRRIDLAAQAKDPFLNPVEMNNSDAADVVGKVQNAAYAGEFIEVFGAQAFADTNTAYDFIATAIAAFESTTEMNAFTSKFDAVMTGQASFTASEQRGFDLFKGTKAKCANCHTVDDPAQGSLFTDFNYFNIGTPVNLMNPAYIADSNFRDGGLGASPLITDPAEQAAERGKFRTPTLRNVELTAPYMHNGVYATLEEVITHYDITVAEYVADPLFIETNFPERVPEVTDNLAEEVKILLGLSVEEQADLKSFMLTLTDGYR